ncbi:MFS transporter [Lacticaseibacillus songhuajiangensis]|uniref:MFS transporter n=1 Tax=Lacticaseibacillus songhuajiangensis TaxID=1296539 RepID=UPI000F797297|nr:MFS transporter [Lacticaseibacillus songhuajiangensis]
MHEFMRLNRNLKLRTLTTFLSTILSASVMPNMTIYYSHYFGAFTTGILLIIVSVLGFISGLYGGHLADVHGRKPIMLIGVALMACGYGVAAAMNSLWLTNPYITFGAFLVANIGGTFADPAEQAMMIDVSTPRNRQFVYAMIYWVMNIGVMLGAAIGGWFFRDYLFELLIVMAAVAVINFCIVHFGMAETLPAEHPTSGSVWGALRSYASVLTDGRYVIFLLGYIASTIVTIQPSYYLAVHLGRDFITTHLFGMTIYGQRMLSLISITNTVMIVFMMSIFTQIGRKMRLTQEYGLGMSLQAVAFAASFIVNSLIPMLVCAIVLTIGEMFTVPASQTLRADMMNPARIGAYSGAISAVRPLSAIVAGSLVSASGLLGNAGMAVIMLILGVVSILLTNKSAGMEAGF